MKNFCADIKRYATDIINYEKKEMLPLTDGDIELYNNKKFSSSAKRSFMMLIIALMIVLMRKVS